MNDLELDEALAGFRDDVPEMSEEMFLLGKIRLEAAVEPAIEPLPEPEPLAVRFEVVGGRGQSVPRSRRPGLWLTAAAACAVLAVGTTLVVKSSGDKGPVPGVHQMSVAQTPSAVTQAPVPLSTPRPSTSYPAPPRRPAAAKGGPQSHTGVRLPAPTVVYNAAGELAVNVADLPVSPGQYLFMARQEWGKPIEVNRNQQLTGTPGLGGYWNEWVPADRSGVWRLDRDVATGMENGPIDGEAPLSSMISGRSRQEGTFEAVGGVYFPPYTSWRNPTPEFVAGLPRDPKALYQRLVNDSADSYDPTAEALDLVGELLGRPLPADLRRSLLQALAYHPWLRIDWNAKTRDGRPAVSLQIDDRFIDHLQEVLVDGATGQLIGTRSTQLYPPNKPTDETIVHWSVVDRVGATS
ncbi:hypothetical protein ALI144C_29010 [Actinosynnema sp. ALI-1.44]|uniref:hypothetical protein n=1 Tax=Actinosynnema sp. ALI-1.44 TaxID=1933779 RepID=UPI00097BC4C2|nr:hypothetical protein [Actinosynnema sp. ALI-1.44]ONI78814.1 hypothetical protein ALI144C_29010 [Actinosynnema sp. ALI-1.44]